RRSRRGSVRVVERGVSGAGARNWFGAGGGAYARFRPRYPRKLVDELVRLAPGTGLAVDVGCGSGQLTELLAGSFDHVIGVDPSADQIANTRPHRRIRYLTAPAEDLPVDDGSADLITAAQAAHWFDLSKFYDEARR